MENISSIKNWVKQQEEIPESVKKEFFELLDNSKKGVFFEIKGGKGCRHPKHKPPKDLKIPQNKGYKYECPNCGKKTIIIN